MQYKMFYWETQLVLGPVGKFMLLFNAERQRFRLIAGRFVSLADRYDSRLTDLKRNQVVAVGSFNQEAEVTDWSVDGFCIGAPGGDVRSQVRKLFRMHKRLIQAEWTRTLNDEVPEEEPAQACSK